MGLYELSVIDAVLPDPAKTNFPVPRLSYAEGATFESLSLAGVPMPGQWLLTQCTREYGWEIRKGNGLSGATLVPIGDPLIEITFQIKIWTSTDAAFFLQAQKQILKKPAFAVPGTGEFAGFGISQPQLASVGVDTVVIKSITPLMNPLVTSGGKGPWTATVVFLEYRQPIAAIKKPNQRIPDKAPPTINAKAAVDIETVNLSQTLTAHSAMLVQTMRNVFGPPSP